MCLLASGVATVDDVATWAVPEPRPSHVYPVPEPQAELEEQGRQDAEAQNLELISSAGLIEQVAELEPTTSAPAEEGVAAF